jgi:hypothetical protein
VIGLTLGLGSGMVRLIVGIRVVVKVMLHIVPGVAFNVWLKVLFRAWVWAKFKDSFRNIFMVL